MGNAVEQVERRAQARQPHAAAPRRRALTALAATRQELGSRRAWMRGRIVRAAYCSLSSSAEGTTTSASTVQNGTRTRAAIVGAASLRSGAAGSRRPRPAPARTSSRNGSSAMIRTSGAARTRRPAAPAPSASVGQRPRRGTGSGAGWRARRTACRPRNTTTGFRSALPAAIGEVERRVVRGALRALHPVDDAAAVGIGRAGAADAHARIARRCSNMVAQHQLLRMRLQVDLIQQILHVVAGASVVQRPASAARPAARGRARSRQSSRPARGASRRRSGRVEVAGHVLQHVDVPARRGRSPTERS